ncbi:MAG: hypothetical protein LBQ64_05305 [Bacteroidales bacterium]|jgi:hypothetical protein|nr:hypothetical protein [Bacteroidales bacterium]
MSNKFRPIQTDSSSQKDFSSTRKPNRKLEKSKTAKKIRKTFVNIFGLSILKKIDFRKNWTYFIMLIVMIVILIYNSLNLQSKRLRIEKLEDEITATNDVLMDVIEEEYNIDNEQEKKLLILAKEEGFQNSGYIPYTLKKTDKSTKNKNQR